MPGKSKERTKFANSIEIAKPNYQNIMASVYCEVLSPEIFKMKDNIKCSCNNTPLIFVIPTIKRFPHLEIEIGCIYAVLKFN